jgi:hypothetical protein
VGWATNEVAWPIPAAPETSATAAPGKRRRDESHGDRVPVAMNGRETAPQKRVRGSKANGILKTARSATRTRHKPAARIPNRTNGEPEQPVRGAERLATPDSQGLHHRSLLGPSLRQGWAVEAADGQLIWGRVEWGNGAAAATARGSAAGILRDPKNFKTGCRYSRRRKPTGHAGRFARSSVGSVPKSSSKSGANSSGTASAWRRTRSRFTSVSIAGITLRAVTHANGTAKNGPPSAPE